MKRSPVTSSNIKSVGYEEKTTLLEVEFNNGKVYQYHPVPMNIYLEMVASESIGTYFNKNIKNAPGIKFKAMS